LHIKQQITEADPRESGLRKALNFGHTLGHALETHYLGTEDRLFHGEAVVIGMIMESYIAYKKSFLTETESHAICQYLITIFGKVNLVVIASQIIELTLQDKKNKDAKVLMALPKGIGKAVWDVEVSEKEMVEAISYYKQL
jgi:3-dehydroquinate synthase